ncbi:MAG TPA: hypothetical protein VE964_17080, partial [Myxococcales bacterium]|nr:hypothetical protein [Myxococcales bacterium]
MRIVTALLVVLGSSLSSASSRAADASTETRLRDALRTTASQLRALEEEQARWKEKEGQYKAELESLREQLAAARKDGAKQGGKREADRLAQSLAEQSEARAKLTESLAQCQKAVRETSEAARAGEEERARQAGRLDGLTARAAACEGR